MSNELKYKLQPETKKPSRKYRKGSKYDPIIEAFKKSPHELVKVDVPGRDANYIRTQLKKRLDATSTTDVTVSVVNNTAYLEKAAPGKAAPTEKASRKGSKSEPTPEPPTEPTQPPA